MPIVCRAPRQQPPAERLVRIYRAEPMRRLLALERALLKEQADRHDADTQAFCAWRLPLVRQILAEREET